MEKTVCYTHRSQKEEHATFWEGVYMVCAQREALGLSGGRGREGNSG